MISGTCWIRKGAAAPIPKKFYLTEEQYEDIMQKTRMEIRDAKIGLEEISHKKKSIRKNRKAKKDENSTEEEKVVVNSNDDEIHVEKMDDDLRRFNFDGYSEDEEEDDGEIGKDFLQAISNVDEAALAEDDEYLSPSKGLATDAANEDEDEDDVDDLRIQSNDLLLIATKTEDDVSYLETYVYEAEDENLYVHHDVMLPSFPLCVEWIGAPLNQLSEQAQHGNYAAVGTFDPEIEIWNLDILETPLPEIVLGSASSGGKKKRISKPGKKKRELRQSAEAHTDAVMSLSWNKLHANLLLSGSADTTVKLWDLSRPTQALRSFNHHTDKVQTLQWNPSEVSMLASAAYDQKVFCFDCRTSDSTIFWNLPGADPECLRWNPHKTTCFAVSDEQGQVLYYDIRKGGGASPVFTLYAHEKPVTSIDWNPSLPDCLLTVSSDKSVKLWNTANNDVRGVLYREVPSVGKAFTGSFCFDAPNLACVAGSKGVVMVVDLLGDPAVFNGFQQNQSSS